MVEARWNHRPHVAAADRIAITSSLGARSRLGTLPGQVALAVAGGVAQRHATAWRQATDRISWTFSTRDSGTPRSRSAA